MAEDADRDARHQKKSDATARTGKRAHCERCVRPERVCVCSALPDQKLQTATRVVILQHCREARKKVCSTPPLVGLCLERVRTIVTDGRAEIPVGLDADLDRCLALPTTLVMYPGPNSVTLSTALANLSASASSAPSGPSQTSRTDLSPVAPGITLVVVDGTWHTARSLLARNPRLSQCVNVHLAHDIPPSVFRFRRQPAPHCISTLECVAHCLDEIEQNTAASQALFTAFERMVELQLQFVQVRDGGHGNDAPSDKHQQQHQTGNPLNVSKRQLSKKTLNRFSSKHVPILAQEEKQQAQKNVEGLLTVGNSKPTPHPSSNDGAWAATAPRQQHHVEN